MRSLAVIAVACVALGARATPLDDYVNRPDDVYKYEDLNLRIKGNGWTGYVLNMTSVRWLTPNDTNIHTWFHDMVVIVPDKIVDTTRSFLWITGGENHHDPHSYKPSDEDILVTSQVAVNTGIVGAALFQIPNQPAYFAADPLHKRRSEDATIAFTWRYFLDHGMAASEWPLRLPMTKAAVRALDTLEDFVPKVTQNSVQPSRFLVGGASKRGWTTWTVGAVDKRIDGIMPIVLDALRFREFMHEHYRNYGGWSFALRDYYAENITKLIDEPNMNLLADIVDPYSYRERLTMPKLCINAVGDEFQMPDDSQRWVNGMPGEMSLLMIQNAEHSMATGLFEVLPAVEGWIQAILADKPRPVLTGWSIDPEDGRITATVSEKPIRAVMRFGSTVDGGMRDFRWAKVEDPCYTVKLFGGCLRPILWLAQLLAPRGDDGTEFVAAMAPPGEGWRAFFIEFEFSPRVPGGKTIIVTTPTSIVPNTHPYPDCSGAACRGTLK